MPDTIFIIDDDSAICDSLSLLMGLKGFATETFASAEAFLERATRPLAFGCVIADVRMTGMTGVQMMPALARLGVDLPVIIITGHGDVPLAVSALKAGAFDFIEKPYENSVLMSAAQTALQARAQARQSQEQRGEILTRLASLSHRERQVLDLVIQGHPNKVIAGELGISARTVEIHRANMMDKMAANTLAGLIRSVLLSEQDGGVRNWPGPFNP